MLKPMTDELLRVAKIGEKTALIVMEKKKEVEHQDTENPIDTLLHKADSVGRSIFGRAW